MMFSLLLLILKTNSNTFIDQGNVLSLVEWGDKIGMFTTSQTGTYLNFLVFQADLSVLKRTIFSTSKRIINTVPVDFDRNGILDVLVVIQDGEDFEYIILWDLNGPPHSMGIFSVEPFIISRGSSPSILTFLQNHTSVLYEIGESRSFHLRSGFGPSSWTKLHSNHQISLSFPSTVFFFTTQVGFEIWNTRDLTLINSYDLPSGVRFGESSFYDLDGTQVHILPVCMNDDCSNWRIYARMEDRWEILFTCSIQLKTLAPIRTVDLDFDGVVDLILPPLIKGGGYLLRQNHTCSECIKTPTGHNFILKIIPFVNLSVIAPFYLQTSAAFLLVQNNSMIFLSSPVENQNRAFLFISIEYHNTSLSATPIRLFSRTFGSVLSSTSYTLLPSYSHQTLYFPYLAFGLDLNPRFVPRVDAAHLLNGLIYTETWKGLIPNSHAYILVNKNEKWELKVFISFGKSFLYTAISLLALFLILIGFSLFLKWRELVEDRREKYTEERRNLMSVGAW